MAFSHGIDIGGAFDHPADIHGQFCQGPAKQLGGQDPLPGAALMKILTRVAIALSFLFLDNSPVFRRLAAHYTTRFAGKRQRR